MAEISVIVPVYNTEKYLRRCVDSILAQTFTDFELILVDDGSTDSCGAICDEYAEKDIRIHVIHQENGGLSAARNTGIDWAFANSDSQWLSFVDSDDWVHPQFLGLLLDAAQNLGTPISACRYYYVETDANDRIIHTLSPKIERTTPENVYTHGEDRIYAYAWDKLYRKTLWQNVRFPVGRNWEDTATTFKVLFAVSSVSFVDAELYFYFMNPEGIVHRSWTPKKLDHLWAIKEALNDYRIQKNPLIIKLLWQHYLSTLCWQKDQIKTTKMIGVEEKKQYLRLVRIACRKELILHGRLAGVSFKTNKDIFETSFPGLMWMYWTIIGIKNRIMKKVR